MQMKESYCKKQKMNILYINENLYSQNFTNGEEKLTTAYVWVKDLEGKKLLEADKIDLNSAITDNIIDHVDSTTKRIAVDTTKTYETKQNINGVATSVTVGKVVVEENAKSKYFYELIKADEENPKEKEFFELAEKIQKGTDNTYESLEMSKKFNAMYEELMPKEEEWKEVENSEIFQPETTRQGDKYVIWLKEINNKKEETIDAKFLVSKYEYEPKYEKGDKIVTTPVTSPVTYDNPALIIIFVIVIIAIIVLVVLKAKSNKKGKH